MRFLLRIVPTAAAVETTTRVIRGIASSMGGKAVNPKRTSYGALEMDVFLESRTDFEVFMAALEPLGRIEFYRDLQVVPAFLPVGEAVAESVSLFNAERFWEAHEVLESRWRVTAGEEKGLLQGLILVCAAYVHAQKDEDTVALSVAKRALPLLAWRATRYHGIEVASLKRDIAKMVDAGRLSLVKL